MRMIVSNLAGQVRRQRLNGREYIVAPVTLIVPGVLAGSKGPLLYPADELARNASSWELMPLSLGHPYRNGMPVPFWSSGKKPLGHVRNVRFNGRLRGEAWVDVAECRRQAPSILEALEQGRPVEVSTGLITHDEPAPAGSTYNGRPFTHIARSYEPDHLAILTDQRGACSLDDGCGLGVNHNCTCGGSCGRCSTHKRRKNVNLNASPPYDIKAISKALGIEYNPATDPGSWTKKMLQELDNLKTYIQGGSDLTQTEPDDDESMDAGTGLEPATANIETIEGLQFASLADNAMIPPRAIEPQQPKGKGRRNW